MDHTVHGITKMRQPYLTESSNRIGLADGSLKRGMLMAALVLASLPGAMTRAFAAPPAGADLTLAPWFQSLAQPQTGYPCCSIADCRTVQYRATADHFEAYIDRRSFGADAPDTWVSVPPWHVLHRLDNPTGEGVACWYNGEVRCFVEGAGI
jgi:hypothetical protein